ncbi:MAG: hypothetical protein ABI868_16655 [Acidobacteriota bacterium]
MRLSSLVGWCGLSLAMLLPAAPLAQEQPLPDLTTLIARARANVRSDRELLSQYTYLERRADVRVSKLAKVSTGPVKVYQVYPGAEDIETYRRLIEVDGRPVPRDELDKQDRERQREVMDAVARRQRESPRDRDKRLARREQAEREEQRVIDELFQIYTFTMVGRQTVDGRPAIALDFVPGGSLVPKTDAGKLMKKVRGRVWVSEGDYQVARVQAEMLDDISVLGFLGKLYKGTTASFERRKVNDEIWLPAEARFDGSGRAFVRKFQVGSVVQYSDYRKFSVETDTSFELPPNSPTSPSRR